MKVSAIKMNPRNPRRISGPQLDKLKESIGRDPEFMRLRPIVVDEAGMVLGGNQRLKAIKSLGMKEVPDDWVVQAKDLTPEQRERFVLVDNSIPGMSGVWDLEILSTDWELPELEELGFSPADLGIFEDDPVSDTVPESSTKEIDPDEYQLGHRCPKCGFEFD